LGFGKLASEEGFSASAGSWDSSGLLLRIKDKVGFRRFAEERVARPLMESLLDTLTRTLSALESYKKVRDLAGNL